MKITDLSIIFVCILFPIFMINGLHVEDQKEVQILEMNYTAALRTAVQDGGRVLSMNEQQELESGYISSKLFRADKELALNIFLRTMYINMDIEDDPIAQSVLQWYIPAIVVMDYDGYYIYTMGEYKDGAGTTIQKPMWTTKKPYSYSDRNGNSIHFTLDQVVEAFDSNSGKWLQGRQEEIKNSTTIPLLQDNQLFEQVRRTAIVNTIQDDLSVYIQLHNDIATRNGISYLFTLPTISQEEWNNTVNDIGMMAFVQGIPVGDQFYNNYALGGGRLVKVPDIHAGIEPRTGIKYYYRGSCTFPIQSDEIYNHAKDAALAGYIEKACYNTIIP